MRDGLDAFHGLSLFHKVGDGNDSACWRHVVVMCVVLLLLVLLGLPLLLLTERQKDIADVAVFASCVFCIFKRNKQSSVVEKHGFMTAGCRGLPRAVQAVAAGSCRRELCERTW